VATDLQRGKMGLCQMITGCETGGLLPCGKKTDNPKYCERWKGVPLKGKDIIGKSSAIQIPGATFKRIEKEFLAIIKEEAS